MGEHSTNPLEMYLEDIFTVPVNIAGLPAISVPGGFASNNMPIGLQFIAKSFDEENCFKLHIHMSKIHSFMIKNLIFRKGIICYNQNL